MSGIKRHIAVDTQGLPHTIHITTANVTDRAGTLEAFPLKTSDKRKTSRRVSDVDLLRLILPNIRKLKNKKSLEKVLALVEKLLSESVSVVLDPNQTDLFDEQDSPN
ncbi:MAG: hypothetical protein K1000chlam3_00888 [Chlamydiae bacterium]|nr:hypothetical protein [Chlamydiota bacterium]